MLINVFSLHRTGSTWWAHYIKQKNSGSVFYNERFNQLYYFKLKPDGTVTAPFHEYEDGCFWESPNEDYTDIIKIHRKLTPEDDNRFDRLLEFMKCEAKTKTIVIHTHLTPIQDEKYLTELSIAGDKNYYVFRENVIEQLSSYA